MCSKTCQFEPGNKSRLTVTLLNLSAFDDTYILALRIFHSLFHSPNFPSFLLLFLFYFILFLYVYFIITFKNDFDSVDSG